MIGALVALLSMDVTYRLVAAGMVASSYTVIGATATSPIILTLSAPHNITRPLHGVVTGVTGTVGANGTWVIRAVSANTVSLSTYDRQGNPTPSTGTGVYISGGTIQTAFPDGSILLGRRNFAMATAVATPRIVFIPTGSPEWQLDPYGGVIPAATALPANRANLTPEQNTMRLARQLTTERQRFEVHVSGAASPPDPDFGDFDATQLVYQTLYVSMFNLLSPDRARVLGGKWGSQEDGMQSLDSRSQRWVGVIEISQPVLDVPLTYVPASTDGSISVTLQT